MAKKTSKATNAKKKPAPKVDRRVQPNVDADGLTRWAREDEDVKLMLRFQAGEAEAFDELVQRNAPKVNTLIYRFLGDPGKVEDLTQEVFLRVFRTAQRYQPTAKFSTWLYRIAANLSFNVLRSRKRARPLSLDVATDDGSDSYHREIADGKSPTPREGIDEAELSERIRRAVAQLPDNQRIAIVLNKFENKSYKEISKVLKCSTMAVKSLLSRARDNLRTLLDSYVRER